MNRFGGVFGIVSFITILTFSVVAGLGMSDYKQIFDYATLIFVCATSIIGIISAMTAYDARKDSSNSAKSAEESLKVAKTALLLAIQESSIAKERYRIENGSLLKLHKNKFYLPLTTPLNICKYNSEPNSKWNYDTISLINNRAGTATTIKLDTNFVNAREFDQFNFDSNEFKYLKSRISKIPPYKMSIKYVELKEKNIDLLKCRGEYQDESFDLCKANRSSTVTSKKSLRFGTSRGGDSFHFRLPTAYLVLAHHFFIERHTVLQEEQWRTPNPRLRVRVEYIEEVLEHMNEFDEARRVKEFEITCSEDVHSVIASKENEPGKKQIVIRCNFNIETLYDRPFKNRDLLEAVNSEDVK